MSTDSYPDTWPRECCEIADRLEEREALLRDALAALRDLAQEANGVERTGRVTTFWPAVRYAEDVLKRAAEAGIGEGGK